MNTITSALLKKNPTHAFQTHGFSRVVSGKKDLGIIVSQELASRLFESGVLQQLQEEMMESRDTSLIHTVHMSREQKKSSESLLLADFRKQYGV